MRLGNTPQPSEPGARATGSDSSPFLDEMEVCIGPDGRLYFHDLDPMMIEVAMAMNPGDERMARRRALARAGGASANNGDPGPKEAG